MKTLLVAALLATACASPLAQPTTTPTPSSVLLLDFKIEPSSLVSDGALLIAVTSDGPTPHNLTIRDADEAIRAQSADLSAGQSDTIDVELEPGSYTIFCAFPGHESLGMRATLTVTN